jgi:RNA polymerase sigma factor (sigma-70 family)
MEQWTIEELAASVIEGNMAAFEELYKRTSKQVYYTCMSFLKNETNVYDAMQDTYLTALTHLNQLRNPERFQAWINQIAVNKCKNILMRNQPLYMEDELYDSSVPEENENFLPESYVLIKEKRELIMKIMEECLSVVQYQTVILYYFDELSVKEIAECMNCLEGTVKFRLSTARTKIKTEVQKYEDTRGQKLYASGTIPFLTAVLVAETQNMVVPNLAGGIIQALSGVFAGAGIATAGTTGVAATATSTGTNAAVTSATTIGTHTAGTSGVKAKGLGAILKTVKAKLIAATVAGAVVVGGGAAAIIHHNQKEEVQEDKGYIEVNDVLCDNEYCTITITGIYPKDEEWKSISEYLPIEYRVENKTDEDIYVEFSLNTYNGIGYDWNHDAISNCVEANATSTTRIGDGGELFLIREFIGKNDFTGGRLSLKAYELTDNGEGPAIFENEFDYYPFGEENYVKWDESELVAGGKEVLNNDQIKITFLGYCDFQSDDSNDILIFYVENKSNENITLYDSVEDDHTGLRSCYMPVGSEAIYVLYTPGEKYDMSNMDNINVEFSIYLGTSALKIYEDGLESYKYPIEVELFPYVRELYPDGE